MLYAPVDEACHTPSRRLCRAENLSRMACHGRESAYGLPHCAPLGLCCVALMQPSLAAPDHDAHIFCLSVCLSIYHLKLPRYSTAPLPLPQPVSRHTRYIIRHTLDDDNDDDSSSRLPLPSLGYLPYPPTSSLPCPTSEEQRIRLPPTHPPPRYNFLVTKKKPAQHGALRLLLHPLALALPTSLPVTRPRSTSLDRSGPPAR
ncbi:hypothetical protein IWX49DRAFT_319716 [Phyllosticta citricarpa]|uniref:Uncharacterized protein n=1 Tax=Phyllosticta citricarpa TaxID=55181 RepID=A0ABR1LDX2_9PEZI